VTDYRTAGEIVEIPKLAGRWRRMPDDVRYVYAPGSMTYCPVCHEQAAGVPWAGWFVCDYRQKCCIALVNTGEVFVPAE
jgi:hypothetical protein